MEIALLAVGVDGGGLAIESIHIPLFGAFCEEGLHPLEQPMSTKARVYNGLASLSDRRVETLKCQSQVPHELTLWCHHYAGAHQAALLKLPDPVWIVDIVPVVAVAVGAIYAARKFEGFLRSHHANLQGSILRSGGCPGGPQGVLLRGGGPGGGVGGGVYEFPPGFPP